MNIEALEYMWNIERKGEYEYRVMAKLIHTLIMELPGSEAGGVNEKLLQYDNVPELLSSSASMLDFYITWRSYPIDPLVINKLYHGITSWSMFL